MPPLGNRDREGAVRLLAILLAAIPIAVAADQDAHALLAKARAAFLENRARERYWNWTTATTRSVLDKQGNVIQELPSVTVESPIRSDGRRCDAVLAWGDGREPYLANASADERCTVEQESRELFREEALFESTQVKIKSRSAAAITLWISADKPAMNSADPFLRCAASVQATLQLDPLTYFPKGLAMEVVGSGCEQRVGAVNHYDDTPVSNAMSTLRKASTLQREFVLQKDRAGNPAKDYWICVHRRSVRPLRDSAGGLVAWGRRFELDKAVRGRRILIDGTTAASELATETILKFETEAKQDK